MRNRLITKIVLSYLALVAVAAPVLWLFLFGTIKGNFVDRLADNLNTQATLIAKELPPLTDEARLDGLAGNYKGLTGARVTIISADGRVLGDSNDDSSRMENHLDRPEVVEAGRSGWGSAVRYSHTLKIDMLYVAVSVKEMGPGGFVRLSMPLNYVEEAMTSITKRVLAGALVIFLASVALGVVLSRRIARRVDGMVEFTRQVASGDFSSRLRVDDQDELGVLASNLNGMAVQLSDKIDAITREKATLEAVLGGMVEGVLVTDRDQRVIVANRRLRETFGLNKEDTLNRPFLEVIRNSKLSDLVRLAHDKRELVTGEVEVQYPEPLSFMAGCVPLMMGESFAGVVLVLHDVTRLKALETARRDFVANVTHELKTPISAIQGFAETLLAGALDEKENARRFLGIIEANSKRLSRLIEDLLTISKIELGEVRLQMRPVSLGNVGAEVAALLGPRIAEKGIRLDVSIPEDMPRVMADRDRLYQVILNVLDNAVKYTPVGGTVTVSACVEAGQPDMVELLVADSGPGIPPDVLPRLGERFLRVDPARSRELGGTGLGLAIVKHLMKAHGGTFEMDNAPRKGAVVKLGFRAARDKS
ncbi:MAG: HAMP domain-containing protein [Nitrospirae bacterium]|nr:HAMP domain-containing protein [Nitrospirota bacterium]